MMMDARLPLLAFLLNPFLWLAIGIAYWAVFRPDSPALKRRVVAAVAVLLILALSSGPLRAQGKDDPKPTSVPISEPCNNVDPNSWWWWFFGCGL